MNITIVIANHKGGVGKTTTAITLATGLASFGYPTVLVDCDSQGSIAQFLNLEPRGALYELVVMQRPPKEVVQPLDGYPTLGVVTGNADTLEIEDALTRGRRLKTATAMQEALLPFRTAARPTCIVIDTAPSLSNIQVSALNAADWLIIPASPEYAAEAGIAALVEAVAGLREAGSRLNLLGVLPTLVDSRSREHRDTIADLRQAFPNLVLPPVRRLIALAEAPRQGVPIWDYAPNAAEDYAAVLASVMKRLGLRSTSKTREVVR